jgi:acyl carrier protein
MPDERAQVIAQFIRENLLGDRRRTLGVDTPLFADGLVDSMGLVLLATFVEDRFGVRIEDSDVRAGEFGTISQLLALIDRRRG